MSIEGGGIQQSRLDAVLGQLSTRGFQPRNTGSTVEARCPAHKDDRPSLSVSEGADGRVLLHCHAGCEAPAIAEALGLSMRDLFPSQQRSRILHTYPYVDERGELLFEAVRFEPKKFAQRRPDGHGDWVWNLQGVRRVLYHLPAVLDAVKRGATVFFVEGEKDADALARMGLVTTTNPMGAGKGKWRSEYTEQLRGAARVVVLPDKDDPGRAHAAEVAKSLAGSVGEVRVLDLPGPGKDASDWISAGGTREQLEQLVEGAPKPPPAPSEQEYSKKTETVLAEHLVARHGADIRYCGQWGKWLVWDGRRWEHDTGGRLQRMVKETLRTELSEAERLADEDAIKSMLAAESRSRRENIATLARYEEPVQVAPEQLDADPMLLGCANGAVDLRTGRLGPHRREALLTKLSPAAFDEAATCPTWMAFLERIFDGNEELIRFIQRAVGYSLTGSVAEQCLFVLWGSGANGKSTFLVTLLALLGEYGKSGVADMLVAKAHEQHPTELADLFGARFVVFQETQEGQRFDESKVKALTGGDKVKARRMREDFWEFTPTHKLWLGTNHRPAIRGTDLAIWRRIRLIPFKVTIPPEERDGRLPEKLRAELPGILRWAVEGCLAWQQEGLQPPREVVEAGEQYRQSEDRLGAFLAECCAELPGGFVPAANLYTAYTRWAEASGEHAISKKALGLRLQERGFEPGTSGHAKTRIWHGLVLLTDRTPPRPEDTHPGRYGTDA